MSALRSFLGISAAALLACLTGVAQQAPQFPPPPPAQQPAQGLPPEPATRIRTSVTEVIVPVTVTDDKGKFVSNLEARDFRILDEGKPQKLRFFSHNQKQPIVVGFLVDMSNNTKIHWKVLQEALEELVFQLMPGDPRYSGYLIGYSSEAELLVNTTSDYNKLADKLRKMKPGGGSSLFDAIYKACTTRELVKGEPYEPRRIIIIMGDGHDNASKKGLEEVLELAQRNLVTIYGISTQAYGFANPDRDVMERLANRTGGHVQYPLLNPYKDVAGFLSQPSDAGNYAITVGTGGYAAQIAKAITDSTNALWSEITTQYVLVYQPEFDPEENPKVKRRIKVDIPSLPGITVRARDEYYPNGVPGSPGGGQ